MHIEERNHNGTVVVSVAGRLDGVGAPQLLDRVPAILRRDGPRIVLDCAPMTYISSAGLRALVICAKDCQKEGGELAIAALQPQCRAVLATSGLLSVLSHYVTAESALAAPGRDTIAECQSPPAPKGEHGLAFEQRDEGKAAVLSLAGRLSGAGAPELEARVTAIVGRGISRLVLDCGRMSYVNSTGMRAMLLCARMCRDEGGEMAIADLQPRCRSVVDMSGFLTVIGYYETSEAALSALT